MLLPKLTTHIISHYPSLMALRDRYSSTNAVLVSTYPRVHLWQQVIRIPGYIADEKMHIARQYLEPQAMADAGVPPNVVNITAPAMTELIGEYCR